jgi:alpha-L-fucosidase 2
MRCGWNLALTFTAAAALNTAAEAQSALQLTYDKPASKWTEALPIGNGRIGAMVFGGVPDERLQINEATLWGGGPHDYTRPDAYAHLAQIRQLIFEGKPDQAEKLSGPLMGDPKVLMPYQPFCDLHLHFAGAQQATQYSRSLRLEDATAETDYTVGSTTFRREAFISFPDQVMVVRLTASQPGQIAFTLGLDSPQPGTQVVSTGDDALQLTGQIQPRQNSPWSWTGSWDQPGEKFAAVLKVIPEGGSVHAENNQLQIAGANAVTILFSNATSFRNYHDISGDALTSARQDLAGAAGRSYDELRRRHLDDFQNLFSRVRLQLGQGSVQDQSTETTDRRIAGFAETNDPGLAALYFEFGRYLLISSSRPGGQPANLQGIWNEDLHPAWSSKWTTNINLEMNYWQADSGDLWETEQPLWSLIGDLETTGSKTAVEEYHSQGWVLHHNTDLWRATAPVDGSWGIWPMGEAWLANQMWDHYTFSEDREFLARQAYPAMKGAADFILGFLVEAPAGTPFAGKLVTNPSTSPENQYILDGKKVGMTWASTMDLELIRELFENTRRAAEILGVDPEMRTKLEQTEQRLPPLQIGKRGQLQEWIEDYQEAEPHHRHTSHLWSLYPGHDITLGTTPSIAAAARRTLELRADGETGWSHAWRTALWARLHDPEQAYSNLRLLISKNTLPDMFDLCPPFQIDGNLGGPAGITEMLVQSTENSIDVLPALPAEWPSGSLTGVRVRGGAKLDIVWRDGRLTELKLQSEHPTRYHIVYGNRSADVRLRPGHAITVDSALRPKRS